MHTAEKGAGSMNFRSYLTPQILLKTLKQYKNSFSSGQIKIICIVLLLRRVFLVPCWKPALSKMAARITRTRVTFALTSDRGVT